MADTEAFDAAVEAVEEPEKIAGTIMFCGEQIPVRPLPPILMLKFAKFATRGIGVNDTAGLAIMYEVIHGVLPPDSADRFDDLATEHATSHDDLFAFVRSVVESNAGRPTVPPSSSPESASVDLQKSKSASRVIDLGDGRIVEIQAGETAAAATARALRMDPADDVQALAGIESKTMVAVELTG